MFALFSLQWRARVSTVIVTLDDKFNTTLPLKKDWKCEKLIHNLVRICDESPAHSNILWYLHESSSSTGRQILTTPTIVSEFYAEYNPLIPPESAMTHPALSHGDMAILSVLISVLCLTSDPVWILLLPRVKNVWPAKATPGVTQNALIYLLWVIF